METGNPPLYQGAVKNTPLGDLLIAVSELGLVAVEWAVARSEFSNYLIRTRCQLESNPDKTDRYGVELREYLSGNRREFSFRIDWSFMRPFQCLALQATLAIPYGETRTYREISRQLGNERAARAVGRAEATNPMPLVIPCHRVIGSDGRLHGYGGGRGLITKEWLLKMEGGDIGIV